MALSVVDHVSATATLATSITTSAISITTGNLIVVATNNYEGNGAVDATTAITDSAGNTYTRIGASVNQRASKCELFYAKNVTGGASVTFTYHLTGTNGYPRILVVQVAGADTSAPLDQGSNSSFTSSAAVSTITSPGITTTVANEILFATGFDDGTNAVESFTDGSGSTATGGWTKPEAIQNSDTQEGAIAYAIVSATGTYKVTCTNSQQTLDMAVGIASFQAAASSFDPTTLGQAFNMTDAGALGNFYMLGGY